MKCGFLPCCLILVLTGSAVAQIPTNVSWTVAHHVGITLTGTATGACSIQSCLALAQTNSWTVESNWTSFSGPLIWVDSNEATNSRKFYRAGGSTNLTNAINLHAGLHITGILSNVYRVQYATPSDSSTWSTLATVMLTASPHLYVDTNAPVSAGRSYRVIPVLLTNPSPSNLIWIAPGAFTMGSPDSEQDRSTNEGPQASVTLTQGFYMGKYLVTQSNYLAVVGSNPSYFTLTNTSVGGFAYDTNLISQAPVERVSWSDATNYCAKLTAQERQAGRLLSTWAYRLPTEAEWEYACRAGTTTRYYFGDDSTYDDIDWYVHCGTATMTAPVGSYMPNPLGLYDMGGNVWEWCQDWYGAYFGTTVTNPTGSTSGTERVIRGGSWYYNVYDCRSASRRGANDATFDIGLRIVLAPVSQ